ncbi:ATP-dependent DNA helicase [Patellaria atrata CBS 101060]|uniref:ATP-dependent DNA helicase n=1 Tax=Patellaria atrata CBS 101060 TaxID=1346257 RepID=A0A9P4SDL5_9PEZI|nr:ATP-dependent DNA helicase [Patellaria atrata CBS 101060]
MPPQKKVGPKYPQNIMQILILQRPVQREVIAAALEGDDVFLQAATSFGKITIVVSPLLALMNNQVAAMRAASIKVATINSGTNSSTRKEILEDLQCGHPHIRLLYVTPEYCQMDHFRRILRVIHSQRELARIAIDEAHCISEWGHDFRPAFTSLSFFKREFPDVPMICCTATATERVRNDILNVLELDPRKLRLFTMTTSRPNLHFEVRFKSDEEDHYDDFLSWIRATHSRRAARSNRAAQLASLNQRTTNVPGIIYTLYRRDCESLAARLRSDGIGAKPYHAGLPPPEKDDHLAGWVANKEGYDVIVATTAFGMGIDKENVRFVIHWQIPKSFEGFYQEAGRAGRDGKAAVCILYYGREDRDRAFQLMAKDVARQQTSKVTAAAVQKAETRVKSLQALVGYCEATNRCRHQIICDYFGEDARPECDYACDWHKDPVQLVRRMEEGLASEEFCSTQRERGAYAYDEYD